jgi:hypothetical protein
MAPADCNWRLRPVEAKGVLTLAISLALQTSGEVLNTELSVLGTAPAFDVLAPGTPHRASLKHLLRSNALGAADRAGL